jgi:hypothetical protein
MKIASAILIVMLAILAACNSKTTPPEPQPPLAIISPANGATLTDPTVIQARPGPGYTYTSVGFFIDSTLVGTDSLAPYSYVWNIYAYPSNSTHAISAEGYTAGPSYSSDIITVRVEYTSGFSFVATYHPIFQQAAGVTTYQYLMFLSTGDAGLEVIDISDIFTPAFLSRFDTPGQALHAQASPPYVLVADRDQGVQRADFSDPDSLVGQGRFSSGNFANDVAVSNDIAFVAENGGMSVLDLSHADTLISLSRLGTQDILKAVAARGDTAFVVGDDKFYIVDCTHPGAADIVGTYGNSIAGKDVAVVDTFAFIADTPDGILALSIADPTRPRFLARFNVGQLMTTVGATNGTLFAGAEGHGVYALEYSIPDTLMLLDHFNQTDQTREVHFQWPYVFVAATNNVYILRFIR